jgi:hypothetical protein
VGAGPRLEDADQAAVRRAGEQWKPTQPVRIAPRIIWPCAPMLNRPVRKASATDSPVSVTGVA